MSPETPPLPGALRLLLRVQTGIAVLAASVIVVSTTADVILRYGFGRPIHGAYDIVQAMLVVLVFHGMAAVFAGRDNITIDLIDHVVGTGPRRALIGFADVVCIAALALLAWAMIAPALQAFDYDDRMLELGLKLWIIWLAAFLGIIGTAICAIGRALAVRV